MTFTGSQLAVYRNLYTQTGNYGFGMNCTVDNTTGQYQFGLSGAQGVLQFTLSSGYLYYGSQFIHTYQADEPFTIEGQFTSGTANVIKDGAPLVYGSPKATGNVDYFYFNRANASLGATFDLYVSGDNAALRTITTQGYFLTTGQAGVTGYFVNDGGYPINVFDSTILATQNYTFGKLQGNVAATNSGAFAYTGDFVNLDLTQPILTTFNTNYGDESVLFYIIDATSLGRYVYLTAPTDFEFNSDDILNRDITWLNYSGGFVSTGFDTLLDINLSYLAGSGLSTGAATGFSTAGIGRFQQSGLLTGLYASQTGTYPVSGFAWATGAATGFFSGVGTGIASGFNYTGLAVGDFTGLATGFIYGGSGTLTVTYPLVGVGLNGLSLFPTGAGTYATGYLDFTSYSPADGFSITNGLSVFTMRAAGGPGDDPAPSCVGDGTYLMDVLTQITGIAPCLSGFTEVGVNGVYDGASIIRLTALTAGVDGNDIVISSDWVSPGDGNLIGGADGIGSTGVVVYPIGQPYTGAFPTLITGSGLYSGYITGLTNVISTKTFSGSWAMYTGTAASSLVPIPLLGDSYRATGIFPPNTYINWQVGYSGVSGDSAALVISGADVLNPISQTLSFL
jgi:hypothetical protein